MTRPQPHSVFIDRLPADKAKVLTTLYHRLVQLLPGAEEVISYNMPGFRYGKAVVAGYDAFKAHYSFFPHSGNVVAPFMPQLDALGFTYAKSGVHFTADKTIPDDILSGIVRARLTEAGVTL